MEATKRLFRLPGFLLASYLGLLLLNTFAPMRASPSGSRTCTNASGAPLYIVSDDGTVRTPSGTILGRVQNGDVTLPGGELVAHNGDAGLLYRR